MGCTGNTESQQKVGIIFMTKSEKYYRQAFEVFALQYLLKPLTYEKLKKFLFSG